MNRPSDPPSRASGCGCLALVVLATLALMSVATVAFLVLIPTATS